MEDKLKLQKKREKIRRRLRDYGILPNFGEELNDIQQMILDQISVNNFSYYENLKYEKHKKTKVYKKRIHKEHERPVLKRARLYYELRVCGILPPLGEPVSDEQKELINFVEVNYETPIKSLIKKYSYLSSPEYSIWYRVKHSARQKNKDFNLDVSDIEIPEYCPYLGVRLITDINQSANPCYYTIDRIDSSKGYVKGNIQVISKLANTMKNNATIEQLVVFSENILKLHKGQIS